MQKDTWSFAIALPSIWHVQLLKNFRRKGKGKVRLLQLGKRGKVILTSQINVVSGWFSCLNHFMEFLYMGYFWNLYATIVLVIVLSSAPCTFFPSPLSSLKEKNYHVYNIYFLKLIEDVRISCMLCSQYRRLNSQHSHAIYYKETKFPTNLAEEYGGRAAAMNWRKRIARSKRLSKISANPFRAIWTPRAVWGEKPKLQKMPNISLVEATGLVMHAYTQTHAYKWITEIGTNLVNQSNQNQKSDSFGNQGQISQTKAI